MNRLKVSIQGQHRVQKLNNKRYFFCLIQIKACIFLPKPSSVFPKMHREEHEIELQVQIKLKPNTFYEKKHQSHSVVYTEKVEVALPNMVHDLLIQKKKGNWCWGCGQCCNFASMNTNKLRYLLFISLKRSLLSKYLS